MGLSSAVTWWEEWQLRVLVLTSLVIQYILYFSFMVRTNPFLHRLRVLVWIAYVSSDAVAIFSLTTLFNRHTKICGGEGSNLEVLWAPLLLIHLGGQPFISAYSLEDNELWKRHTVTLVSQLMVALYVFCRWWSGEKKLLAVAVLLFIIGILRFAQKPWSLRLASFNSFQASSTVPMPPTVQRVFTLEDYVQAAKRCVLDTKVDSPYEYNLTRADISRVYDIKSDYMFVDRSAPYSIMDIIISKGLLYMTEEILVREILNMTMLSSNDMISNALRLARALMQLGSEEERWIAVQGVWVEMLCYSANRCRGYLHAKSMGDGGECLTIIWLLLSSMGMETFADRHHRSETPQEEADEP